MKKIIIMFLSVCMLLCITACNQNSTSSDSAKEIENITIDKNYTETLKLINEKEYKKAYKKINDIKDKKLAEELKSKFIVIKDVLLSKTIVVPDDNLGNKVGPYTINYFYDEKGNIIEIDATTVPIHKIQKKVVNHLLKNAYLVGYQPYHETLIYDDNNKLLKVTGYYKDTEKIIYTADFIYDKKGNNNKIEYATNSSKTETFFEYNDNNQLILARGKDNNNEYSTLIEYDNNGNILEDGTIYNDKGKVIESTTSYYYGGTATTNAKCIWNYGDFYIYNK